MEDLEYSEHAQAIMTELQTEMISSFKTGPEIDILQKQAERITEISEKLCSSELQVVQNATFLKETTEGLVPVPKQGNESSAQNAMEKLSICLQPIYEKVEAFQAGSMILNEFNMRQFDICSKTADNKGSDKKQLRADMQLCFNQMKYGISAATKISVPNFEALNGELSRLI